MQATSTTLVHQIVANIGSEIVSGKHSVGDTLPSEALLCQRYEVSRTSMREGIKMLSAKGLVESRPKIGITVLPKEHWSMLDCDVLKWMVGGSNRFQLAQYFIQIRYAVEPQAAVIAALNSSHIQRDVIADALEKVIEAKSGLEDQVIADIGFSHAIMLATNNPFFLTFQPFTVEAINFFSQHYPELYDNRVKKVAQDIDIYQLIKEQKGTLVKGLVESIIRSDSKRIGFD
jgi:DNA-binding FadR family transcriptional regulator